MLVQVLSDTHCNDYKLSSEADLIIHLGDFGNGNIKYITQFKEACEAIGKPHLCVLGNHDFYDQKIADVYANLKVNKINYLIQGEEWKLNGVTFVGGTLFTAFKLNAEESWDVDANKQAAQRNISDFYTIKRGNTLITPDDYVTMHNTQRNWIEQYRGRDDVVVCTHFPPNPVCLSDYWKEHGGLLNAYFINDIPLKGFKHWFSGHTHSAVDAVVDGCRVVVNPLGYVNELGGNGYRECLLVEV